MLADLQAQYPGQKFIFTSLNQNESLYTFEYTSTCQETYKLDMEKPYFKIGSIVTVKEDGTK
ncbi:MAG: hypothetical protein MJ246_05785 [Clostridia bacterium]|nr:hypothetical protein [Clostridia bacterium]